MPLKTVGLTVWAQEQLPLSRAETSVLRQMVENVFFRIVSSLKYCYSIIDVRCEARLSACGLAMFWCFSACKLRASRYSLMACGGRFGVERFGKCADIAAVLEGRSAGEVSEWLKEQPWKGCVGLVSTAGSNPALSGIVLTRRHLGGRVHGLLRILPDNFCTAAPRCREGPCAAERSRACGRSGCVGQTTQAWVWQLPLWWIFATLILLKVCCVRSG